MKELSVQLQETLKSLQVELDKAIQWKTTTDNLESQLQSEISLGSSIQSKLGEQIEENKKLVDQMQTLKIVDVFELVTKDFELEVKSAEQTHIQLALTEAQATIAAKEAELATVKADSKAYQSGENEGFVEKRKLLLESPDPLEPIAISIAKAFTHGA